MSEQRAVLDGLFSNRQHGPSALIRACCLLGILSWVSGTVSAQAPASTEDTSNSFSALPWISGFDAQRLGKCAPITDTSVAAEMARLIYRLQNNGQQAWPSDPESLVIEGGEALRSAERGQVLAIDGQVSLIRQYKVPEALIEYLDLAIFHEVLLDLSNGRTASLFAPPVNGDIAKGDRITASGVMIRSGDGTTTERAPILVTGRLSWFPTQTTRAGWKLLASLGMDLSLIAETPALNRRRLQAADSDAFYGLLRATQQIGNGVAAVDELPEPKSIKPLDLLTQPKQYHGEWIQMQLSTVRVTRVQVNDVARQTQLGQDHYFQIDTSGDLGNTVVELAREQGDEGPPIQMSGSYPVTLVATQLPPFLVQAIGEEASVVSMVDHPVRIQGFFYRLWSYENEFMSKREGGKQVGPLVAVASWESAKRANSAGEGIAVLGYAMALGLVVAIVSVLVWSQRNARQDAQIRKKQLEKQRINVPTDTST